jgi:major intracellular serine protease
MRITSLLSICCITLTSCSTVLMNETELRDNFTPSKTKPIVVAVIDTGIDPNLSKKVSLCRYGSKDFTGTGLADNHGHGSHVAGIIDSYAKGTRIDRVQRIHANYCMVILKYFDGGHGAEWSQLSAERQALRYAINLKVDIINMSLNGRDPDKQEEALIKEALDKGIRIVVSAGNDGFKLSRAHKRTSYPAMYDYRLNIVGNLDMSRHPAATSNSGSTVNAWEVGTDIESFCKSGGLCKKTGTSMSTAVRTGKIIRVTLAKRSHQQSLQVQ